MNIQLPQQSEEFLNEQAASAGFSDVSQYVLTLVEEDKRSREIESRLAQDGRLERLALEGLDSGDAGVVTDESWAAIRDEVFRRESGD